MNTNTEKLWVHLFAAIEALTKPTTLQETTERCYAVEALLRTGIRLARVDMDARYCDAHLGMPPKK